MPLTPEQLQLLIGLKLCKLHEEQDIPVGNHAIRGTLALAFEGGVLRHPDTDAAPTVSAKLPNVLALFSQRLNVKLAGLYDILFEVLGAAYANEEPAAEFLAVCTDAADKAKAAALKTMARGPKRGSLSHILTISDVEIDGAGIEIPKPAAPTRRRGKAA